VERYKNLGGDSSVRQYQLAEGSMLVQFDDGSLYEYTNESAGGNAIATMYRLAVAGRGLCSFISTTVRKKYSRKIRWSWVSAKVNKDGYIGLKVFGSTFDLYSCAVPDFTDHADDLGRAHGLGRCNHPNARTGIDKANPTAFDWLLVGERMQGISTRVSVATSKRAFLLLSARFGGSTAQRGPETMSPWISRS
jgi:hypothetical protein